MPELNNVVTQRSKVPFLSLVFPVIGFFLLIAVIGVFVNLIFEYYEAENVFKLRGVDNPLFNLVPHVISILIITVFLIIIMIYVNRKIKHADPFKKPKGILLLVEILVTTIDNFTMNMLGEKLKALSPYIGFLAIYLFTANVFGLLGFTPPPTANLSVTFSFGLTTFILVRYYGFKINRWGHIAGLFKPLPLSPINIIGELAVPFTLSIRLFGNILSGAIIMTLIYTSLGGLFNTILVFVIGTNFTSTLAPGGIGEIFTSFVGVPFLHIYFDLFSGFIQTFVFVLLSSVFITNATN